MDLFLRDVEADDLPIFFRYQTDSEAIHMAAFTAKDPEDRAAFDAHWQKIMADETVIIQTIILEGQVAGSVLSYEDAGRPEVSFWIGKRFWGKGVATRALELFLAGHNRTRPIYARAAKDNIGSQRVLEKCGYAVIEETKGYANACGREIEELVLKLE